MKGKNIVMSLFLLSITLISCKSKQETIEVKIQAIDSMRNLPRKNLKVEIFKVKNPLFSMRSFILTNTLKTNNKGFINFKTNRKGKYSIRFYKDTIFNDSDYAPLYRIDTLSIKNLKEDKFIKLSW